jgi:hypothetical protein
MDTPPSGPPLLSPEFCFHAANQAFRKGEWALGAALVERYLAFYPEKSKAWYTLGRCRNLLRQYEQAEYALERGAELRPHDILILSELFAVYSVQGKSAKAETVLSKVVALDPGDDPKTRTVWGVFNLLSGDYERGWPAHEARWDALGVWVLPFPPGSYVRWNGEQASNSTLCIHAEGGYGDGIMFSRFIPEAASRVESVFLCVPPPLQRLLANLPGVAGFVDDPLTLGPDTLHTSWFSLPAILGVTLESLNMSGGYLHPPVSGPRLSENPHPRIGLVWAGSPNMAEDHDRSVPDVAMLAPLVANADASFVSLQAGSRAGEALQLGIEPMPTVADFADTAYLVDQLDLVITVDTSVGHLAGALGKPVWIITPSIPEYRWLLKRDDSPWYDSARLFRRNAIDDWDGVLSRVSAELDRFINR